MLRRGIYWVSVVIVVLTLLNGITSYCQVVINEVCASNTGVINDVDGDFEDWIEIFNRGLDTLNLGNYCLSDDSSDLAKWSFPDYLISSGQYLTIFASGKDRTSSPLYWHTIIDHGDDWKYILPDANTPSDWRNVDFDDSSWKNGQSGFGYGDNDDATVIPSTISIFLRKHFYLEDTALVAGCVLHMDYDDGFVAYINGKEIARSGIFGNPPAYNTRASSGREATIYNGGKPRRFDLQHLSDLLQNEENVIAIQVHNISATSTDLSAIPFLSLLTPLKPIVPPPQILEVSNTHFHTNFKLDADGETLCLTDPEGIIVDSLHLPGMGMNHSYGRRETEPYNWAVFDTPTPGQANNTPAFEGYMEDLPVFSPPGGRFADPFQLYITARDTGDTIYYTLDGAEPTANSFTYEDPLEVSSDMIIRARIIKSGLVPGDVVTNTYFTGSDNQLPVVSISTDPDNLWDYHTGIYEAGPYAEVDFPYFNANFWQDWERPAHIGLYDKGVNLVFNMDGGIQIYGGWTRGLPQKSIAIYARSKYGTGEIEYQLFEDKPISEFESFVIRNSGNDWFGQDWETGTMFRDVLMTRVARDMDLEYQSSRQAIVYINGQYWGIHNIREKINEHFLASNQGVDPEQLDLLEGNQIPLQGDPAHYASMISFLQSNDIMQESNYKYVKTQMDIQNFINYQVAQIFYDNTDWPGNNIKYWRPKTPKGKWRWILFDTDFGFGLWNPNNVYNNTLLFATETNGPNHPNPPWSTYLLRKLLLNREFKELFINSFADRINTNFNSNSVSDLVDELKDAIDEEMFNHVERWGGSYQHWINQAGELKDFARLRPGIMQNYIKSTYGLESKQNLTLDVSDPASGYVRLNTIFVKNFPWEGTYYQGIPVELIAIPRSGYRFTGWTGGVTSSDSRIRVNLSARTTLVAQFEAGQNNHENPVIINEICYKQDAVSDSEDWVELYNNSNQFVDVSGWTLKDSDNLHSFHIKSGRLLKPGGYQVICRSLAAFETVYPSVFNYEGEMNFGLSSNGEIVRLYNQEMDLVDSVRYGVSDPWPEISSGSGYTLALLDPNLDNSLAESWDLSLYQLGTPGSDNSVGLDIIHSSTPAPKDILFQNSPNPFSCYTRIVFYSCINQPVRISIYDLNGRLLKVLFNRTMEAGYHEFEWVPGHVKEGIFILRVETPGSIYTQKMIKHR